MGAENTWAKLYGVAVLETDWLNIGHSIQAAEDAIRARLHEFSLDHGGTLEENKAIENALHGLDTLRKDVIAHHQRTERGGAAARVLVVEDHEPFRRFVCSSLSKTSELQIVDQVSDGLHAVGRAEELQPDLIVLDIGLPSLNGIEVARRVRNLSPKSKILFLSQESCPDVVQAALRSGASGYVLKSQAGIDLLRALEAVREGRLFISSVLLARDDNNTTPPQVTIAGSIPSLEA
jgi:DNA-binding NarL/FixJ family response regulator